MKTKVLLTGGFGNIGKATLDKLLKIGHAVVCLDRETVQTRKIAEEYAGQVNTVWGDIGDPAVLGKALEGVEVVVHLAGIIPPLTEQDPELAERVIAGGTRTIIAAMEASTSAKRLVFASTFGVFGRVQDREPPLRNDSITSPDDHYGRTKVAAVLGSML